jgi:hypothetical protein
VAIHRQARLRSMEQGDSGRVVFILRPTAVGIPRTTLLSQDLLFDGPGGTSFLPGTILMHLNDHSHGGKEPAIMRLATHPTGF